MPVSSGWLQKAMPLTPVGETEHSMETILLVENDPATLVARSMVLRSFGYTVLEAGSRGETWCVCNEHQGPIHLAILDNVNAHEFITRLQILCPQIRALLMWAKASAALTTMPCECSSARQPALDRSDVRCPTKNGALAGAAPEVPCGGASENSSHAVKGKVIGTHCGGAKGDHFFPS